MRFLSLSDLIAEMGEDVTEDILSSFHVGRNRDVEDFIHESAIPFEKSNNARSFLFLDDSSRPLGFVSLALTTLMIPENVSASMKKNLKGFGRLRSDGVPCYLIGQLARFDHISKEDMSGDEMFTIIADVVKEAQSLVGGRVVSVDCVDGLVSYYEKRGFRPLNKINDLNQMVYIIRDYRKQLQF